MFKNHLIFFRRMSLISDIVLHVPKFFTMNPEAPDDCPQECDNIMLKFFNEENKKKIQYLNGS